MSRTPKQPKPHQITTHVRGLGDAQLAELITTLRVATRTGQATLAKALQEQKRRRKQHKEPAAP
ncbi:hypothetical protein [Lysobacter olei]